MTIPELRKLEKELLDKEAQEDTNFTRNENPPLSRL